MPRKKKTPTPFTDAATAEIIAAGTAAADEFDRELIRDGRASHNHRVLTSSENPNWTTPQWLFDALDDEFDFALDCAADAGNHKCPKWLGPGSAICEDALVIPWNMAVTAAPQLTPRPAVFVNHPYSRKQGMLHEPWLQAAATAGKHIPVVAVVPFSPQTRWWRRYVFGVDFRATEIRRFPYRIKFAPPPGYEGDAPGANVNTAIVIWRPDTGFMDPWQPHERYWDPKGFGAPGVPRGDDEE